MKEDSRMWLARLGDIGLRGPPGVGEPGRLEWEDMVAESPQSCWLMLGSASIGDGVGRLPTLPN